MPASKLSRLVSKITANPSERRTASAQDPQEYEPYTYQPLQEGEIRVFRLHLTGQTQSVLTGELLTQRLKDRTSRSSRYTCLSYAWGPTFEDGSHLTDCIICDGCTLKITATLKQALIRIRKAASKCAWFGRGGQRCSPIDSSDLLWIDAICINQQDLEERNVQVRSMYEIYSCHGDLLIWLGEPDAGELGALQVEFFQPKTSMEKGVINVPVQNIGKLLSKTTDLDELTVMQSILDKAWFKRRWIIQEVAAACNAGYIMLGDRLCTRSTFCSRAETWTGVAPIVPLQGLLGVPSISELLYTYDDSACHDPRDRVFALSNISRQKSRITIDYNQDVRNTYLNLFRRVVFRGTDVNEFIADFCGGQNLNIQRLDLAEAIVVFAIASCKKGSVTGNLRHEMELWVPDWTVSSRYESAAHLQAVKTCVAYSRRGPQRLPDTFEQPFSLRLVPSPDGYVHCAISGIVFHCGSSTIQDNRTNHFSPTANTAFLKSLETLHDLARLHCQDRDVETDMVWLPMAFYKVSTSLGIEMSTIAPILRRNPERKTFDGVPVYRLHSCRLSFAAVDYDHIIAHATTLKEWLEATSFLSYRWFCLE